MRCPTVRVKADASLGGFVVINKADFDPTKHELYELPPIPLPPMPPVPPASTDPQKIAVPRDWPKLSAAALKTIAETIGGRTPENREQAVQIISAALENGTAVIG